MLATLVKLLRLFLRSDLAAARVVDNPEVAAKGALRTTAEAPLRAEARPVLPARAADKLVVASKAELPANCRYLKHP